MDQIEKKRADPAIAHLGEDFVGSGKEGDRALLPDLLSLSPFGEETNQT